MAKPDKPGKPDKGGKGGKGKGGAGKGARKRFDQLAGRLLSVIDARFDQLVATGLNAEDLENLTIVLEAAIDAEIPETPDEETPDEEEPEA